MAFAKGYHAARLSSQTRDSHPRRRKPAPRLDSAVQSLRRIIPYPFSMEVGPMSERTIQLDGRDLSLQDLDDVSRGQFPVAFPDALRSRVAQSCEALRKLAESDRLIYGVNTGFGIFSDRRIARRDQAALSYNLILSHASATGRPYPEEVVRAATLIRANSLSRGHSGIRPEIIDLLIGMLNAGITPVVPAQGSLGSSGDLAPLAHLALVFSAPPEGEQPRHSGEAWYKGVRMSGAEALRAAGLEPLALGPKEGLALTNGATFTAALLGLAAIDAARLEATALVSAAMSFEALLGKSDALNERLHRARNHPGQIGTAEALRALISGSTLVDSHQKVQDAYSLRCIPQIHGPARELLPFIQDVVNREINASTDNPLLFGEDVISGGNFHGQILGSACDYLKLPMAELGLLSERRVYRLMAPQTSSGLNPMLIAHANQAGLQSGLMMLQYTAASLVLENESLATPDSVRSLPTSAGQEDLNANSTTAARRLRMLLKNLETILAIEMVAAAQALDLRLREDGSHKLGSGTASAHAMLRNVVPFQEQDQPLTPLIEATVELVRSDEFRSFLAKMR